jgi:hypothetical protein
VKIIKVHSGVLPILLQPVAVGRRAHQRDVSVLVLAHGHAHHALELWRVGVQDARQRAVEVVLAVVEGLAAAIIGSYDLGKQ